ncbi:HD family phosphohydrolase [Clostridium carboxidivorans P7]|uniref:Metal dependent phosphohydrolase n=1 Tax=Clostridium carboxidivorans P7 TaxID=536227 RepID=C6PTT4_9CLOT|nr:HD-GYP domain-containing protein [Clostridium carboxidivorans]AKN31444.1 HD family phosphohydrolase [Clostridium carboxidivorans P7]EET87324.1 metal dependent phosphohydrolase [Clostridium carboxidivorans P7]EFG87166.1 HD domain protein [Clostridium carboxidivorans P7]
MEKHKKLLNINDLKVGTICAKEIKSQTRILIEKGVPITECAINKLRDIYFCNKIEVYCEDDNDIDNNYDKRIKTIEKVEKNFSKLSLDTQQIFEDIDHLQSSGISEVRKFASKIQKELEHTNAIIKDIVIYGSGSDTIYRHGVNVAALSTILGKWIGLSKNDLNLLTYSAILHDFGKTKIDKNILDKPGPLTSKEFNVIKNHPAIGYNYIKQIKFLDKSVSLGVLMHHEKSDGSGYPLGLKGDKIHKFAKIIAIADVFDAVNSDRIYKKSKKPFEALELIQKESLVRLDYEYCNIFLNHVINYYMGENVLLNNGAECKIIQVDVNNIRRPLLLDDTSFVDLKNEKDLYIEKLIL